MCAMPATIGQLRTKVSDMQIGDYITCSFKAITSGSLGSFSNFGLKMSDVAGNPNYVECPYTGITSSTLYQMFYFIKAAKGLLISDRVIQNSINFDTLNTGKVIQGLPWDAGNIIPTMTSNIAPSGVVSSSSIYSASYDAWKAFDGDLMTYWYTATGTNTGWLAFDFGTPKIIKKYCIKKGSNSSSSEMPKNWTFEGYDSVTSTWEVLDTQTNQTSWVSGSSYNFLIKNNKAYQKYRINISANNGSTNLGLDKLEMMDTAGIIRSLTGGVAYVDANGNSSTTDAGKGAWPQNSEWDKFIVNFDSSKIQVGKTLDDVFHGSNISTWTQDTPILALTASTTRILRGGGATAKQFGWGPSSSSNTSQGFRPAFEYKE
jgi:hypothetical protein